MSDSIEQDRPIETIEEMPAAPEADQGTRDADAPTWAAPTEGHERPPIPSAAALGAIDGGPEGIRVSGDRIEVRQAGAERIEGSEISIVQGGAGVIRGDHIEVEQGGAFAIIARRITLRDSGAFLLLARRTDGQATVVLDWRGLAAVMAGILAIVLVRRR
jgi:hypothetical protein